MKSSDQFESEMRALDDKGIVNVLYFERHKYLDSAIEAAQIEFDRRNLDVKQILNEINIEKTKVPEKKYNVRDLKYLGILILPYAISAIGLIDFGEIFLAPLFSLSILPIGIIVVKKVNRRIRSYKYGIGGLNDLILTSTLILSYLTTILGFFVYLIILGMVLMML